MYINKGAQTMIERGKKKSLGYIGCSSLWTSEGQWNGPREPVEWQGAKERKKEQEEGTKIRVWK